MSDKHISAVIPVFNEAERIRAVIDPLKQVKDVSEIIVVDDGSEDGTAEAAEAAGARVIRLTENQGKAAAMDRGVLEAENDVILFLDGDIRNITPDHIERIIGPVRSGRREMFIGITERKSFWLNRILHFFPLISGQRAVTRDLWNSVPMEYKSGFQIELALNYFSRRFKKRSGSFLLRGVGHTTKEKKQGFFKGFMARISMMAQIVLISFRLYIIRTITDALGLNDKAPRGDVVTQREAD
jgi:glycosyltransferase involved in cell wall biosynthesis